MYKGKSKRLKIKVTALCGLRNNVFTFFFLLFAFTLLLPMAALAQDDLPDGVPPPLTIIPKYELKLLDAKKNIKDRTKLSLDLMKIHLLAAEKHSDAQDFESVYRELGIFHGLMDDAMDFLNKRDNGGGKVLDNFKRLELGLRAFTPQIEVIRRELPLKYDPYIRKVLGYLRSARTKATESLFSDTVVPQLKP